MAWQTPKTDWKAGDVPSADDFNRIEGNILELQDTRQITEQLDAHANSKQTHGVEVGYYIAKTIRNDQLPHWAENADKLGGKTLNEILGLITNQIARGTITHSANVAPSATYTHTGSVNLSFTPRMIFFVVPNEVGSIGVAFRTSPITKFCIYLDAINMTETKPNISGTYVAAQCSYAYDPGTGKQFYLDSFLEVTNITTNRFDYKITMKHGHTKTEAMDIAVTWVAVA